MTKVVNAKSWTLNEWTDGTNRSYPQPELPAWLVSADPAIGEWVQVPSTALSDVSVPGDPENRHNIVNAWCGACIDERTSTLWIAGAGGHNDYTNVEAYSISLDDDAPAWALRSSGTSEDIDAAHTYAEQVFSPEKERVFRMGNGSRPGDGLDNYRMVGFNPAIDDWDPVTTWPFLGSPNQEAGQQSWSSCRRPSTGDIYQVLLVSGPAWQMRVWRQASNTVEAVATSRNPFYGNFAWDTTRDRGVWFGFHNSEMQIHMIDSNESLSHDIGFDGAEPEGQDGFVYVPALDKFFFKTNDPGGAIQQVDAGTFESTAYSTTGGASIPGARGTAQGEPNGIFSRMQYCPNLGGIALIASFTGNIWFLKLHDVGT